MVKRALLLVGCLLLVVAVPSGQAQALQSCGEGFELFIRNPDITPDGNGVFHVSGRLLVQFQVIGERADEIEAFGLSFGVDLPTGEEFCELPSAAWLTGAYLEAYSLDKDKEDGFFVGINSNGDTSPQYDLGVAVHGYDAGGTELARFWGIVRLDHCGGQPSLGCPGDPNAPDFTMPWMQILPGDGVARPVNGFAMEFNEVLANITVELNGIDITAELEEWTQRPMWDQDSAPSGPQLLFDRTIGSCTLPEIHSCTPLNGPAYQWTKRQMTDDDIIRVVATDMAGNVARKEIHIGSSVAGGTISDGLPVLQMTFEESTVAVEAGQTAVFSMIMENTGGGEGHPFASAEVPPGWDFEWVPGHEPVPAGGNSEQEFHVKVPHNATEGLYQARAIMDYRQGSADRSLASVVNINVLPATADPEVQSVDDEDEGSPGLGLVALVGLLIGAVAVARRR